MTTKQLAVIPPQAAQPLYWFFVSQGISSVVALECALGFARYIRQLPLNILCMCIQQRIEDKGLLDVCAELSACRSIEDAQSVLGVDPGELTVCGRNEQLLLEFLKSISETLFFRVAEAPGMRRE